MKVDSHSFSPLTVSRYSRYDFYCLVQRTLHIFPGGQFFRNIFDILAHSFIITFRNSFHQFWNLTKGIDCIAHTVFAYKFGFSCIFPDNNRKSRRKVKRNCISGTHQYHPCRFRWYYHPRLIQTPSSRLPELVLAKELRHR